MPALAELVEQARLFACPVEQRRYLWEIAAEHGIGTAWRVCLAVGVPAGWLAGRDLGMKQTRHERLSIFAVDELAEKGKAIRNPLVRDGYYAGLTAVVGRREMERVRKVVDDREAGRIDIYRGAAAIREGFAAFARAFKSNGKQGHDARSIG